MPAHPVLAPRPHRGSVDRQVNIADHRPLLDLRGAAAAGTSDPRNDLLDHQLHIRAAAQIVRHSDVLQPDQRLDNLTRLTNDEGASN